MRSLFRSTLLVSACNVAAQGFNFLTLAFVARQFGAGADLDGYWFATAASQVLVAVVVTAVQLAFLPEQVARRQAAGEEAARLLARRVIFALAASLLALASLAIIVREPLLRLLAPGLSAAAHESAASVACVLWPSIAISGVLQILVAHLQGLGRFGLPALSGVLGAASSASLVILMGARLGVLGVAAAMAIGLLLQVAILARFFPISPGARDLALPDSGALRVFSLSLPLMVSALFVGLAPVLERRFASQLGTGVISHLAYASRIVAAEMTLVSSGLTTVLFARFASHTAVNDRVALGELFGKSFRSAFVFLLPLCLATILLARPIVGLAFERGSFGPADTASVAEILRIYALALLPMALGAITGRVIYSLQANRFVAAMAAVYLLIFWTCASLLSRRWGALGIAAATPICLVAGLLFNLIYIRNRIPAASWAGFYGMFGRSIVASVVAGLGMILVRNSAANPVVAFALAAPAGAVIYLGSLAALRSAELRAIVQELRSSPAARTSRSETGAR